MNQEIKILFRKGNQGWQELTLLKKTYLIGRAQECDLVLDDQEVSRHHAHLNFEQGQVFLVDLNSSNGTFVDGRKIQPQQPYPLPPGKMVMIGTYTIQVQAARARARDQARFVSAGSGQRYRVLYQKSGQAWKTMVLPEREMIIGRGEDVDLFIDGEEVSRHHAVLTVADGKLVLRDLNSTNGTILEGVQLAPGKEALVRVGQTIQIGEFNFQIELVDEMGGMPAGSGTMIMPGDAFGMGGEGAQQTMVEQQLPAEPTQIRSMNLADHDRVTIGRAYDNQVVLNHPLVSRYHAVIERVGKRYRIKDLRSTNGVFVNDLAVEGETFLKDHDQIRIGSFVFVLAGERLQGKVETGLRIEALNINQQVSKDINLLKNINLIIEPNEFVALVGMSGSGKTTFLNALSGYWPASHGQVKVNGVSLYDHYDMFRNDIGYVPQKDIVHVELTPRTALDYVAQLRMPPDTSPAERRSVVQDVLEQLDLQARQDVPISSLSGGQLKRVSIGVELLTKPRLFFLDEPTSGLDPGTEYNMMMLMRKLADQGRTVILITHATKNVMLCDKVIFLARGGNLAFYGAPENALAYFDQFRTDRERREKKMEFDDIYRILDDDSRGEPEEWRQRYLQSEVYARIMGGKPALEAEQSAAAQAGRVQSSRRKKVSALRQFFVLSSRNLKIMFQDKVSMALMLAIAPILGLMDFIWGGQLYDPVEGDATKIITAWFMMALITVLVGALSSVREIVKENDIYKRERAVNLKILPYILSKVWVGVVLAIYQAGVLMFFRMVFMRPDMPSLGAFLALYITLFLSTLAGYVVGLMISAAAPNQNVAMMLIIVVLVPQFLFAGALLPLDLIPGGEMISFMMPTRWGFESMVRITGMGEKIAEDPCWVNFSKADRLALPEDLKVDCPCLGMSIFTQCGDFPGVLSEDIFDEKAQMAVVLPKPEEPPQPTAYPYPTAYPSPTPLPTPTSLPSPTPLPTPFNPAEMANYMDRRSEQGAEYQDQILGQFEDYRLDSQAQGAWYSDLRTEQGDEYKELRQQQGDEYTEAMQEYGDERAEWQEARDKAISSAEAILGAVYDNFPQIYERTVFSRWMIMGMIIFVLLGTVLIFQKRKDVV